MKERAQDDYSADSSSPYQLHTQRLIDVINRLAAGSTGRDVLTQVACWGTADVDLSDAGIRAARTLVKTYPSSDSRALLAYVLYDRSRDEATAFAFAADGSPEKERAKNAYDRYLTDAENMARNAISASGANKPLVLDFVLGAVKDDREQISDAITLNMELTTVTLNLCGTDLTRRAYQALIRENSKAHKPDEAEKWFRRYAVLYQPEPYEWDAEGDRRNDANDPQRAADAYERAANVDNSYAYDFC